MLNTVIVLNSCLLSFIFLLLLKSNSIIALLASIELVWSVIILSISLFSIFFNMTHFLYLGILLLCFATVEFSICIAIYYTYIN